MKKKGQITIFLIAGLLILVGVLLFFYMRSTVVGEKTGVAQRIAEDIPLEFVPIKTFTEECLRVTAEHAVVQLGQQGGYIKPLEWNGLRFDEKDATDSDGIVFSGSDVAVPYWVYNKARNDASGVTLASLQPSVRQMEKDVERYINEELPLCLAGYIPFTDQGFIISGAVLNAVVTFVPGSSRIALEYPLTAMRGTSQATFRHFFTELDVDMLRLYELADKIARAESNSSFLEKNTLTLITLFSGTGESDLPPMTESTFEFTSTTSWQVERVKSALQLLLMNYIPVLRFLGSGNYFAYDYPSDDAYRDTKQRIYDNMALPLSGADGVDVRFDYLGFWEPYLQLNAEGNTLRPQSTSVSFGGVSFGVQRFKTVYDISYPVWVSLSDPRAFHGQGFFFNFALEANVRNNRPVSTGQQLLPVFSSFTPSLLCDEQQRHSGDVTIVVQDAFTFAPLLGASVSYALGDESCALGITDEKGTLIVRLPVAVGGSLLFSHPRYGRLIEQIDTVVDVSTSHVVHLWQSKTVDITIQKKELVKNPRQDALVSSQSGWVFNAVPHELGSQEHATLFLRRVGGQGEHVQISTSVSGAETTTASLVPGLYEVTIDALLDERVFIPPEEREKDDVHYWAPPEPGITFEQLPHGRVRWTSPAVLFEVKPSDLYTSSSITFYVLSAALQNVAERDRKIEDIELLNKLDVLSQQYRTQLEPIYKVS